ncbi:MAG: twin-arginine translocase TatA/TatE family subunit [Anaerolineae bacterium]|nr:twin-arginine translocase TatA/TatE family subunit [Thermoflexales bacterium]MDW8053346.1 twin-arginine translocase TatA/TatE family subunit [Anaerolineae bacterium]
MNGTILGVGPLEVLLIGLLILIVFGPERLPEFARGLGRALRRLREAYVALTYEFRDDLRPVVAELQQVTQELQAEVQAIRQAADLRPLLNEQAEAISQAASLAPPSNGSSPASSTDVSTASTSHSSPAALSANHKPQSAAVVLPSDNPWSNIGATVRSDALDEDNPWRA